MHAWIADSKFEPQVGTTPNGANNAWITGTV